MACHQNGSCGEPTSRAHPPLFQLPSQQTGSFRSANDLLVGLFPVAAAISSSQGGFSALSAQTGWLLGAAGFVLDAPLKLAVSNVFERQDSPGCMAFQTPARPSMAKPREHRTGVPTTSAPSKQSQNNKLSARKLLCSEPHGRLRFYAALGMHAFAGSGSSGRVVGWPRSHRPPPRCSSGH